MNTISVYQCEFCKKESRVLSKLLVHEVECREKIRLREEYNKNLEKWDREFLDTFHPTKIDECVNAYIKRIAPLVQFSNMQWRITYNPHVRNSHAAPFNGVRNWEGNVNLPRGYPGFEGKITGDYSYGCTFSDIAGWGGGCFKKILQNLKVPGVHTGSGGGTGNRWGYEFYFFIDDFPTFKKEFEERHLAEEALEILSGNYDYKIKESYEKK